MLHNMPSILPKAARTLEQSGIDFYLTGSRAWRTATEKSDWDFFTQDNEDTHAFLITNGFKVIEHSYDSDPLIETVYEKVSFLERTVQVQMCRDVARKQLIQRKLMVAYPAGFKSKAEATKLWNLAYDLTR